MTTTACVTGTAKDLLGMLRRHYLPDPARPAGIFAPEIAAPGSSRRADLIWQGVTAATDREMHGHEIKVTRADLLTELADLTKSDPWQQYCDRWWLVVPHSSLLDGLTLPATWGVLTPPSGRRTRSMTVHTPAPALRPSEQAPALRTLAAWQHWALHRSETALAELRKRADGLVEQNRELALKAPRTADPRQDVVARVIAGLGGQHTGQDGIGEWNRQVSVEDVVAALRDLGEVNDRRDDALRSLTHARQQLEQMQRHLSRVLDQTTEDAK